MDTQGTMMCYGKISSASGDAAVGTVDEGLLDIGRIMLLNGAFPTAEDEIAIQYSVSSNFISYTVSGTKCYSGWSSKKSVKISK